MAKKQKKTEAAAPRQAEAVPTAPAMPSIPALPKELLWVGMAILVALVVGIYYQTRVHDFIYLDDNDYIVNNKNVRTGLTAENVKWAFTSVSHYYWQPLTWISHMVDCQLFSIVAGPHHVVSMVIHAANAALLAWSLWLLTGAVGRSVFAAGLFALHPLRVESVAWAAERKDVLSGFFWMLTLAAYAYYAKQPSGKRYALLVAAVAGAAMSKPTVVPLPFVLLLLDFWPLGRLKGTSALWPLIREKLPLFAMMAALSVVTYIGQSTAGATVELAKLPVSFRVQNAIASYGYYIWKFLWPAKLSVFYPLHKIDAGLLVFSVAVLAAVTWVMWRRARWFGYWATGWLWFLGAFAPTIGVAQSGLQSMADRFTYIPMIGLCLLVSWVGAELVGLYGGQWKAGAAVAVAVCVGLSVVAYRQTGYWVDTYTLFDHSIEVTEDNDYLHMHQAQVYYMSGNLGPAGKHIDEAVRIEPNNGIALWLAVQINISAGKREKALEYASRAAKVAPPGMRNVHRTVAMLLWQTGRAAEARAKLEEMLRVDPNDQEARSLMMMVGQ